MITIWIINCQRPLSIIEDSELIEILQYLNPKVQLVKADTIKNTVMTLYSSGKRELKVSFIIVIFKIIFIFLLNIYIL